MVSFPRPLTLSMTSSDLCFYCRIGSGGLLYDMQQRNRAVLCIVLETCVRKACCPLYWNYEKSAAREASVRRLCRL